MFCDLVIASESATFGQPEIKVGLFPPIAALHYPARIPIARTLQLLFSGEVLPAREAERIGLADRVVPAGHLETAVAAAVAGFTDKSTAILRLTKEAVRAGGPVRRGALGAGRDVPLEAHADRGRRGGAAGVPG